jgi:hypothetical protein
MLAMSRADAPSGCGYSGICSLSCFVVSDTSMPRRQGILTRIKNGKLDATRSSDSNVVVTVKGRLRFQRETQ